MNSTEVDGITESVPWTVVATAVVLTPIIVVGIFGNICSLLVWIKGRRRKTSTARFLSALAIADIVVLLTSGLEFWIGHVTKTNIRISSSLACKFLYYMSFSGPSVSAWILVAVTVERMLSVWLPHKINVLCRPLTAMVVLGFLLLCVCVIYLPFGEGVNVLRVITQTNTVHDVMNITSNDGVNTTANEFTQIVSSQIVCIIVTGSVYMKYLKSWIFIDLCLFFILPYAILISGNGLIIAKVICLSKLRKNNQRMPSGTPSKSSKMLRTVTKRIVILSIVFCVCNAPISIFNTMMITGSLKTLINKDDVDYYRVPFHFLMYLNNGVNFFLYCVIGSSFRKDLIGIFRGGSAYSSSR